MRMRAKKLALGRITDRLKKTGRGSDHSAGQAAGLAAAEAAANESWPASSIKAGPLYSAGTSRIHELTPEERAVYATLKADFLPEHVAIIMDGNGRWAGNRSLKRFLGHQQGAKSVQLVTETASRIGLPWLTLYAFSLENNLRRPKTGVNFLMRLLKSSPENNVQRMKGNTVRIRYSGRVHELPREVQDRMQWAHEATARNAGAA